MLSTKTSLALCAGLLGLLGCAHDAKPRERASATAVTNEEVADNRAEQGKTRGHYTEIGDKEALGHQNGDRGPLAESEAASTSGATQSSGMAGDAESCELAVYFETDSTRLDQGSQQRLDRVADCMKRKVVDHATIVGQTDPSGTEQHNDQLGLERARVVAEYLRGRGVPDDQIRVRSKGEVASAQSRELWPVERRAGVDVKQR